MEDGSKGLSVNGRVEKDDLDSEELVGADATAFRATAARVNYLAQDCADIQYAAKEVCREMSRPTAASWKKLKVVARFMLLRPAVVSEFGWQDDGMPIELFTDSDWAGCRRTRKSTSGGAIRIGSHCIRTWSSTQVPIALSSAEAEYYSMVDGATKAFGIRAMLREVGMETADPIQLSADSSAARAFAARRGLGRMRHVETRMLWLQSQVLARQIVLIKVPGEENPADLMTKYLTEGEVKRHLSTLGMRWVSRPGS